MQNVRFLMAMQRLSHEAGKSSLGDLHRTQLTVPYCSPVADLVDVLPVADLVNCLADYLFLDYVAPERYQAFLSVLERQKRMHLGLSGSEVRHA